MKEYFTFHNAKTQEFLHQIQLSVKSRNLVGGVLLHSRDTVGVFYDPNRLVFDFGVFLFFLTCCDTNIKSADRGEQMYSCLWQGHQLKSKRK